jgi:hypothetical protein
MKMTIITVHIFTCVLQLYVITCPYFLTWLWVLVYLLLWGWWWKLYEFAELYQFSMCVNLAIIIRSTRIVAVMISIIVIVHIISMMCITVYIFFIIILVFIYSKCSIIHSLWYFYWSIYVIQCTIYNKYNNHNSNNKYYIYIYT